MHGLDWGGRSVESSQGFNMNLSSRLDYFTFYGILSTLFVAPFSVALKEIFLDLTILFWILQLWRQKNRFHIPKLGWAFLFFLLVTLLSVIASEYKAEAIRGFWGVASYTALFFIVCQTVHSPERVKKVIWVLILSTTLWALAGMIHQYLILKKDFYGLLKFFSLGNKNAIGQYLQMILSIMVGIWMGRSFGAGERRLLLGAILICLGALFLSSSKTMWIAFFITLLLFSCLKKSRVVLAGTTVLLGILVGATFLSPQVSEMGAHIVNFAHAPSMQERYLGWEKSYLMFLDNPIFGVGPKCYMEARDKYQVPAYFGQAHNMILHVACEMGLLGVAALFIWIGVYARFIGTYRPRAKAPIFTDLWFGGVGYLVTLAIGGLTEPTIGGEHSMLFMTVAAMLHGGIRRSGNEGPAAGVDPRLDS
jgi:O-antigen ligase